MTIITIAAMNFSPPIQTMARTKGGKCEVQFVNADDVPHQVEFDGGEVGPRLNAGESSTVDLTDWKSGDHPYRCRIHPFMRGTVCLIDS